MSSALNLLKGKASQSVRLTDYATQTDTHLDGHRPSSAPPQEVQPASARLAQSIHQQVKVNKNHQWTETQKSVYVIHRTCWVRYLTLSSPRDGFGHQCSHRLEMIKAGECFT
jgi:predicted glycoside hydrolase/deacetylase ChbG (UPF0249 family)